MAFDVLSGSTRDVDPLSFPPLEGIAMNRTKILMSSLLLLFTISGSGCLENLISALNEDTTNLPDDPDNGNPPDNPQPPDDDDPPPPPPPDDPPPSPPPPAGAVLYEENF
ncbi:MAG TPA: hypothetical protein VNM87_11775, partial [Candidatus Udaeobacter sp.]|nr:hypothetical protein [Candidatus Udaeobacter sp.]